MGIETLFAVGSLAASAGSGILGAFGASTKSDADQAMYAYKAQVARNNAAIARRNAQFAVEAGGVGAQTNDLKTKNLIGSQTVAQASSGLDVNTGSAVDLRQSARDLGHLDTMTILANATKKALGFKDQAANFESDAQLAMMGKDAAATAGDFGVASSLLGGATSFADKWSSYSQKGVFS